MVSGRRVPGWRRLAGALCGLAAVLLVGLLTPSGVANAAVITVTTTSSVQNTDGQCSLIEATLNAAANDQSGSTDCLAGEATLDEIRFNILGGGVQSIGPNATTPYVLDGSGGPITLDGYTQTGAKENTQAVGSDAVLLIELNGTGAPAPGFGLIVAGPGITVRGLVINRFTNLGIEVVGAGAKVEGCYIGTDAAGTTDLGNSSSGIGVLSGANVTIGGTTPAARNVISGNNSTGISANGASVTGLKIQGNYIGTDKTGTLDLGNSNAGISLVGTPSVTIGGTAAGAGNVISGNNASGVSVSGATATDLVVQGNSIGTSANGLAAVGNSSSGISLNGTPRATIGGDVAGAGNLISGNTSNGVVVSGAGATGVKIQGNMIGTDSTGAGAIANFYGVFLNNGAPGAQIGGTTALARNVISGNSNTGVLVTGTNAGGATIQGNYIGLTKDGTGPLPNGPFGISVGGTPNVTVGGSVAGAGNVVSAGVAWGVLISGAPNLIIQGNYIGTDATGLLDLGNGQPAIQVDTSPGLRIGGTTAAARNVIAGNDVGGVSIDTSDGAIVEGNYIGVGANGTTALTNGFGVSITGSTNARIGGTTSGAGNVISANAGSAVRIATGSNGAVIQGNFIGTDPSGTVNLGNGSGVVISDSANVTVGGTDAAARNVISGNGGAGIIAADATTTGLKIQGNYIGVNATNSAAMGNGSFGIHAVQTPGVLIGGTTAGAGNVIAANALDGIVAEGPASTGATIQGNQVGLTGNGTVAAGNGRQGIAIAQMPNTMIGGTTAGARNIVASSFATGISIQPSSEGTQILGNYIGTDVSGTRKLGNSGGVPVEAGGGIQLIDVQDVTIGGTSAGARNVISGNAGLGISIFSSIAIRTTIVGNFIGTAADGTADLGNGDSGLRVLGDAQLTLGGTAPGAANVIAFNGGRGVVFNVGPAFPPDARAVMRGNSIFSNSALGIDLAGDGVTANDAGDADGGPDGLQNYPVLASAVTSSTGLRVSGMLNSTAGKTFDVDLYGSPDCDPSGNGEGKTYLGTKSVTTGGSGDISFIADVQNAADARVITATATRADSPSLGTSEFSACRAPTDAFAVAPTTATLTEGSGTTFTVALGSIPTSPVTITVGFDNAQVAVSPATLTFPSDASALTPQTVTVTAVDNQISDGTRTATLALTSSSSDQFYNGAAVPSVAISISDNEGQAGLNVADATATEPVSGVGGVGTTTLTVTLSPPSSQAVTVQYATANGAGPSGATGGAACGSGADYLTASGTLTFSPGVASQPITISVCGDGLAEPSETFTVSLSNPTGGAGLGSHATATVTIADATGLAGLTIADATTVEPAAGTRAASLTVSLSPPSSQTVTVQYATANGAGASGATGGTACTSGVDYVTASGTLTFGPGDTSKAVSIQICADNVIEPSETFTVSLSNPTGGSGLGSHPTATVTIGDTTVPPRLTIADATVAEPAVEGSTATVPVTVTLVPASPQTVTVRYATANGPAGSGAVGGAACSGGVDYLTANGTLTFSPGETSKTIAVSVCGDGDDESAETFSIALTNPTIATIGTPATATVTIGNVSQPRRVTSSTDDTDKPQKETEEQRQQRQNTNKGNKDDVYTEGNVTEVHTDEQQPYVMVGNKDGLVKVVLLCGDQCPTIRVGDYLEADGEKVNEQLFEATDVTVKRAGR